MKRSLCVYSLALTLSAAAYPAESVLAQKLPVRQAAKAVLEKSLSTPHLPGLRTPKLPSLPAVRPTAGLHTGTLQNLLSNARGNTDEMPQVDRIVFSAAAQKTSAEPAKDMRQSVAKVLSSFLEDWPEKQQPSATAFVFKTHYNGKEEIWGATAAHIAKGMGQQLTLVFYEGDKKIVLPAEVVQYGPNMISDLALLKLPENLPPEIVPLPLSDAPAKTGEAFIAGGYSNHRFIYTGKQHLQKDNSRFLRTDFFVPLKNRAGLCGSPLINAQGEVAGILCGSIWEADVAFAANTNVLSYLLEAQHKGSADIPLVAGSIKLGDIKTTEHIHSVEALNAQRQTIGKYDTQNRLPQSTMLALLKLPDTHFLRFMLEDRGNKPMEFNMDNPFRYLIYNKEQDTFEYQPIRW